MSVYLVTDSEGSTVGVFTKAKYDAEGMEVSAYRQAVEAMRVYAEQVLDPGDYIIHYYDYNARYTQCKHVLWCAAEIGEWNGRRYAPEANGWAVIQVVQENTLA